MGLRRMVLWSFVILISGIVLNHAQTPSNTAAAKADYTKQASVIELFSTKIAFENDGTSVRELAARVRIQSDAGVQQYGLLPFGYQASTQTVEIDYVRVRKPDGTVVVTPVDNIQDLDAGITRQAPFYSDLREKHVAVKGLSSGDTVEYLVHWRMSKPLAPGQFWYAYDFEHDAAIVLDERLQVSVPLGKPLKLKSPQIKADITEENGRRVYKWKSSNLEDHSKDNGGARQNAAPGQLPPADVQISTFQSWDEVGRWYGGLQKDRVQPTAEIRVKAAELTKGSADSAAALHAIYDYVSTKFRYIGIDFGIGRYQPHTAADVLSNQYGDCKDKHTLLASLLQASGIAAYPALISTSHVLDPDVPSPAQFDHVISVVPQGKDFVWLDTTTEVGPFGYLISPLRGKQALVITPDKTAELLATPSDLPIPNTETFKVEAKLGDDGTLNAEIEDTERGDGEVIFRSAFRQTPQAQWKDLVQQISYRLGFAGTVSDTNATPPEATNEPFHYSYTYNRKDYPDWTNHRITMPGLPFTLPTVTDDANSETLIWLGPPMEVTSDSTVELPNGYQPELPVAADIVRDYAEYHASYRQDRGVLKSRRRMVVKLSKVPEGEREDYKHFVKSVQDDVSRYIVVSSVSSNAMPTVQDPVMASLGVALRSLPDSSNAEAQKFEKEALAAMGSEHNASLDLSKRLDALKQAVAADPKFTRGWIILGSLYTALSQADAEIDAFRKAIDSDPKQPISYRVLAFALASLSHQDEAIKVWQDLLKVVPNDPDAISNLGLLLVQQKRYAEAVPLLEATVKDNPSGVEPLSRLGIAYLKSGNADKGFATIQDILDIDSHPPVLNSVAYELADADVKLPEALDFAKRAVLQQEGTLQKVQLAHLKLEDLRDTERVGQYWDTLGWVHLRLGHLDEAEEYLRASWLLSQRAGVADHLAQVYEKQNKREAAIHTYRLALAALETERGGANRDEIQQHLSRLLPGINLSTGLDLHRGGSTAEELSRMRAVKVPRVIAGSASAEIFLLFGPGGRLEDVKFISGSDKLKSADKIIRSAIYPVSFPGRSTARVVRRAILSCSQYSGCEIVLYNPDTVKSIE